MKIRHDFKNNSFETDLLVPAYDYKCIVYGRTYTLDGPTASISFHTLDGKKEVFILQINIKHQF